MKIKVVMILVISLLFMISNSEAAKIDVYKKALLNKSFTLKYEITTPPIRQVNKSSTIKKTGLFQALKIVDNSLDSLKYSGIVVVDGENRYTENSYGICKLIKNNEVFNFRWDVKNNKKRYYGSEGLLGHSKNVKAQSGESLLPYSDIFEEYNYNDALFKALGAILPTDRIIATPQTPQYKFLGSGTLSNGLTYEDFSSVRNNTFFAARYYFEGNNLVKISVANCTEVGGKIIDYEKTVVAIKEFSTTPDRNYLSLPNELKDKTRRK